MDSETLMKFVQSLGVSDYGKAKKLAAIRKKDELVGELLKNTDVIKNYKRESDIIAALQSAGIYYKF